MCDNDRTGRFLLYLYVLELWVLTPFIINFCDQLGHLESKDYPWYNASIAITIIHTFNTFTATLLCTCILCKRYKMWKRGNVTDQIYSYTGS